MFLRKLHNERRTLLVYRVPRLFFFLPSPPSRPPPSGTGIREKEVDSDWKGKKIKNNVTFSSLLPSPSAEEKEEEEGGELSFFLGGCGGSLLGRSQPISGHPSSEKSPLPAGGAGTRRLPGGLAPARPRSRQRPAPRCNFFSHALACVRSDGEGGKPWGWGAGAAAAPTRRPPPRALQPRQPLPNPGRGRAAAPRERLPVGRRSLPPPEKKKKSLSALPPPKKHRPTRASENKCAYILLLYAPAAETASERRACARGAAPPPRPHFRRERAT